MQELVTFIRNGFPKDINKFPKYLQKYWSYRDELNLGENLVFKGTKVIIPKELQNEMLNRIHYTHLGKEKCKNLAREVIF